MRMIWFFGSIYDVLFSGSFFLGFQPRYFLKETEYPGSFCHKTGKINI